MFLTYKHFGDAGSITHVEVNLKSAKDGKMRTMKATLSDCILRKINGKGGEVAYSLDNKLGEGQVMIGMSGKLSALIIENPAIFLDSMK